MDFHPLMLNLQSQSSYLTKKSYFFLDFFFTGTGVSAIPSSLIKSRIKLSLTPPPVKAGL
jgi:hypothetical protein